MPAAAGIEHFDDGADGQREAQSPPGVAGLDAATQAREAGFGTENKRQFRSVGERSSRAARPGPECVLSRVRAGKSTRIRVDWGSRTGSMRTRTVNSTEVSKKVAARARRGSEDGPVGIVFHRHPHSVKPGDGSPANFSKGDGNGRPEQSTESRTQDHGECSLGAPSLQAWREPSSLRAGSRAWPVYQILRGSIRLRRTAS